MNKKIIVFDVDGTLRDNHNKTIYPKTIYTLKELKKSGHILVIASGRNMPMLDSINEILYLFDAFILINGTQIIYKGKTIYADPLPTNDIKELIDDFKEAKISVSFVSSKSNRINSFDDSISELYKEFNITDFVIDEKYYLKEDIYQIWCFGELNRIKDFSDKHPNYSIIPWGDNVLGYDVIKLGNDKAKALSLLINYLHFDIKDVIAIGDSNNDISLLKLAGLSIAMGNGSVGAKESSDYVTDDITNDGLYKAFKHFKLVK